MFDLLQNDLIDVVLGKALEQVGHLLEVGEGRVLVDDRGDGRNRQQHGQATQDHIGIHDDQPCTDAKNDCFCARRRSAAKIQIAMMAMNGPATLNTVSNFSRALTCDR